MSSVYLSTVTGDGTSSSSARSPMLPSGAAFACLMLDVAKDRCLVLSPDDTLTGTGVSRLVQAASWAELVDRAKTVNPTAGQRTAMTAWLSTSGYVALTAVQVSWWDCIHHAAQQVNPAADLSLTRVGE